MQDLGFEFTQVKPDIDESVAPGEQPADYVGRLAEEKAMMGLTLANVLEPLVVAADTIVVIDGNILGKPTSKEHGVQMLQTLSGREHEVLTGLCVAGKSESDTEVVSSRVRFRDLSPGEIEQYWDSGEPSDKAGAYGIQGLGSIFVESVTGSYTNVVGLPLSHLHLMLRRHGVNCLAGSKAGVEAGVEKVSEEVKDSRYG